MLEAQKAGVKGVAWHCFKTILDKLLILREGRTLQYLVATISLIVEEWVANILHVNTNLVRSTRFEAALHQRYIAVATQHFVVGNSVFALRAIGKDIHLMTIFRIATNVSRNCSLVIGQVAPHERNITTLRGVKEELVREVLAGLLVLADNENARSVLVNSMHQAGTLVALLEHRVILQMES